MKKVFESVGARLKILNNYQNNFSLGQNSRNYSMSVLDSMRNIASLKLVVGGISIPLPLRLKCDSSLCYRICKLWKISNQWLMKKILLSLNLTYNVYQFLLLQILLTFDLELLAPWNEYCLFRQGMKDSFHLTVFLWIVAIDPYQDFHWLIIIMKMYNNISFI